MRMEYDDIVAAMTHIDAAHDKLRDSDNEFHQYMSDHLITMRDKLNKDLLEALGGHLSPEALRTSTAA